jgi:hypothetical protein
MPILRTIILLLTVTVFCVACEEKGPMEKAGEKMDQAVQDAGNSVEDACENAKESMGVEDTDC